MLKVGQIRKNTGTTYLQDLGFTSTIVQVRGVDNKTIFDEFAITIADGQEFQTNTTYYLRVAMKRAIVVSEELINVDRDRVQFQIKLYTKDGSSTGGDHAQEKIQTLEKNGILNYCINPKNEDEIWMQYDLVFTPNDNYKYLAIEITRNGYDYITEKRKSFLFDNVPAAGEDTLRFGEYGDFAIVKNILPQGQKMTKIGIQSRPGSKFVVNREPIILGRSGIYEINNGTKITSVGIVAPNGGAAQAANIQDFLLDYGYNNSDEEA